MDSASETRMGRHEIGIGTPSPIGLSSNPISPATRRTKRSLETASEAHSETDSSGWPDPSVHLNQVQKQPHSIPKKPRVVDAEPDSDEVMSAHSATKDSVVPQTTRRRWCALSQSWKIENFRSSPKPELGSRCHAGCGSHSKCRYHDKESDDGSIEYPSTAIEDFPSVKECLSKLYRLRILVPYQIYISAVERLRDPEVRLEIINCNREKRLEWLKSTVVPPEVAAIQLDEGEDVYDPKATLDDISEE